MEYKKANGSGYKFNENGSLVADKSRGIAYITYDYGARQHDPILARWDRIDPMCEKNPDVTPYHFCHNYPVNRVDFDGKWDVNVHLAKDRTINGYGVAVVSDKNGQEIFKFIVRAEGVKGHDRTKIGADTPLGTYDIPDNNAWTNGKSRLAYGPNDRLIMNPESGEVVEYGRSDIRIHGGRQEIKNQDGTWQRKEKVELKKTYGCLRASDNDMKTFKAFTDYLESTDNQEKPGKVFINDDLERYNKNKNE
jgi:RHS repeat-associated protein